MNDTPSVTDFPMEEVDASEQIKEGDMALIVRLDGTIGTLAFNTDTALLKVAPEDMSDEQVKKLEALSEQGETMFALSVALMNPLLMKILKDVASDPNMIDAQKIAEASGRAMRQN